MSKTTRRVYKIAAAAAFTAGSVAAIPATFAAEAPADQQQQVVDQKATAQTSSLPGGNATETPKAEAPKAEATQAPKAEAPKTEAPKTEATEAPNAETPKAEATEAPKAETPAPTAPATEAPKAETPKAETPAPTAPATEAPKAETPKAETPKAEATEAPKAETPKAETPKADASEAPKAETPAPTAPAAPEPTTPATPAPEAKQADPSVVIENAHFPGDAQFNTVSVVATGFYGEKVGPGVQVSIYALDANNQVTGDAIATVSVSADQIQDGSFKTAFTVEASKLPAGASYALVAVSNPQGQPEQKLVALSSFKVTESTSPKTETPKADETPAPVTPTPETPKADETPAPEAPKTEAPKEETPAPEAPKAETPKEETPAPEAPKAETPKADETPAPEAPAAPENATLTTEDASLNPNDQYNVLTINGSGFTHESVAQGVQINIYRLDADGNITGEALATYDVPASEIMEGTFRAKVSILSERLQPGYAYAMVATSDPNGLVHQVAVTTAVVSDADHPAPTLPAATEGDNTTVRDNGDGTTSVFTAEMREDGSVVVTETRMPSSQAPKAKVGNASAATSSKGHGLSTSGYQGSSSTSSSSSKQQLAHTGAEGVAGIAGVGAAALIAGAALMLLRRRSL